MLEPVARSGPARRLLWRQGESAIHTPLLIAPGTPRAGSPKAHAERLIAHPATADRLPSADEQAISVSSLFLEPGRDQAAAEQAEGNGASKAWAQLMVGRAARIEAQLALTRGIPRPAHEHPSWANEDTAEDDAPTAAPVATASPDDNEALPDAATASAGLVVFDGALAVIPGAASVAGDAGRLAGLLVAARDEAGPARLLYAPGTGLVHHAALLVYAGIDVLDTLAIERASLAGLYCTSEGVQPAHTLKASTCACTHCRRSAPSAMDTAALRAHNLQALSDEIQRVAGHIENDTLRALVETRARAHSGSAAFLRRLDAWGEKFAARWPIAGTGTVHATTLESLSRPDVARYRARIRQDYVPPTEADVLLLLPCSATKPYARSKSHRIFRRVIIELRGASRIHEVILTSPLGAVPRELELTWPAAHYDVPVTGHYDGEESRMLREQVRWLLARGSYSRVVSHLDAGTQAIVADLLPPDTPHTAGERPTSYAARDALRHALIAATREGRAPSWPRRRLADATAILSWQFGAEAAQALATATSDVSGRPPGLRLYATKDRRSALATFVPERGLFALTLEGARVLHAAGHIKTVEIDDFTPRGTIFAVGVKDADPRIVPDDEVLLMHAGETRGVGRARMNGAEMRAFDRGAAVEVRHHA